MTNRNKPAAPERPARNTLSKKSYMRILVPDLFLVLIVAGSLCFGDVIGYLLRQGVGQARIITRSESRESYLAKPGTPPEHREKLALVEEIRQYAFDSLGLKRTRSYTKVYDQEGQALLWVITASHKYALEPKTWKFPITGEVTYKGFFHKEDADDERARLEAEGWEVRTREVNAWSTLGYLPDPILSEMLNEPPGDMANVIIHELSHSTVFIRGDVEESENLASFIGDVGAALFLEMKFGKDSRELFEYRTSDGDYRKLTQHLLRGANRLDSLYGAPAFKPAPDTEKDTLKTRLIRRIIADLDTVSFSVPDRYGKLRHGRLPNNAFFIEFRQYNNRQNTYYDEYRTRFDGDLRRYIVYLKEKYGR